MVEKLQTVEDSNQETDNDLENQSFLSFKEFLEEFPVNSLQSVEEYYSKNTNNYCWKNTPQLRLWCDNENCQGFRRFDGNWDKSSEIGIKKISRDYLVYLCRDCGVREKTYFILSFATDDKGKGKVLKIGEFPEIHIDLPSYLPTLLGEEYKYFIKGLKCEKQGLGIGAFSYYRRVVENQKTRFLEKIINVARKLQTPDEMIFGLEQALKETQFSRAVDDVRDFIPKALYVDRQNPMTILYQKGSRLRKISRDLKIRVI